MYNLLYCTEQNREPYNFLTFKHLGPKPNISWALCAMQTSKLKLKVSSYIMVSEAEKETGGAFTVLYLKVFFPTIFGSPEVGPSYSWRDTL